MHAAIKGPTKNAIVERRSASLLVGVLLLLFGGLMVARAEGAYEQAKEGTEFAHFGAHGEAAQLKEAKALAMNEDGMGGVQAGSFYAVGRNNRVVRFAPGHEGEEPQFEEAWGFAIAEGGPQEYVRCGPAYHNTANPADHTFEHCLPANPLGGGTGGEGVGEFNLPGGVAVDQTTGDVYVRNYNGVNGTGPRKHHLIEVFTAEGEPVGEGFGDSASGTSTPPQSIAESPEELHRIGPGESPIVVSSSGTVYLVDEDFVGVESVLTRVMAFEPCTAGNYEQYCYANADDISLQGFEPFQLSFVGTSRIVAANVATVREYPLSTGAPAPVCTQPVSGQLFAMTANALSGEVFYFTVHDHSIHRLEACDEATGDFSELPPKVEPQPQSEGIFGLTVNPSLAWGPNRPSGVVYAVDSLSGTGDVLVPAVIGVSPTVEAEVSRGATTSSTSLRARIDPKGFPVSYHFEYLSATAYLANGNSFEGVNQPAKVPATDGQLTNNGAATVTAAALSLEPRTEYVFRAVATSKCKGEKQPLCVTVGVPTRFTTYPTTLPGLPDNRAYEIVSPPEKQGGEVFPTEPLVSSCLGECKPPGFGVTTVYPMQSASDGTAVTYMGSPFFKTEGSAVFNSYLSRRTESGWETRAMSPTLLATRGGEHLAYSSQLAEDVISQTDPQLAPQAPPGYKNLYIQSAAAPTSLTPMVTSVPTNRAPGGFAIQYEGHSPDFSAQFFSANDALTSKTAFSPKPPDPGSSGRDLYEWHGGVLSLVNVLPGNVAIATDPAFASASPDAHSVSSNGRRIFWQANGHLYVREDGQVTREISQSATFLSASENGLEALLSDGCVYSLLTEVCTDLTEGQGAFLGVVGTSGDLSHIYFVDSAVLPGSGQNERREEAQAGKPNLYNYEAGVGSRFVVTLAGSDGAGEPNTLNDWSPRPTARTAEASPDGRYLVFGSTLSLTGYGNVGPCDKMNNPQNEEFFVDAPCAEVFFYDSVTGRLTCASCNPTGEAPLGPSTLPRVEDSPPSTSQPKYLTNQGRLVFDSGDRLSPLDGNGRVEDVYEVEPGGVGSCGQAAGCVSLISQGTGMVDSDFLAMDETGANIFFTTRERLVPSDTDELIDLYDAREGGGFPTEAEGKVAECQGEACQSAPISPSAIAPSSQLFGGPGNPKPRSPKCREGKVRKRGKCVRQRQHKKQQKRASGRKIGRAK